MTDETQPDPNLNVWANRDLSATERQALVAAETATQPDVNTHPQLTADQIQQLPARRRPSKNRTLYTRGRFVRPWGLRYALYALVGTLAVIIISSLIISGIATASVPLNVLANPDPSVATDAVIAKFKELAMAPLSLFLIQIATYAVWVITLLWATFRKGLRSLGKDFWIRPRWSDIPIGIAIAIGLQLLVTAATEIIPVLFPNNDYSGFDNAAPLTSATGIWFWVLAIGVACILGPICEELLFRGLLLQGVRRWLQRYSPHLSSRAINISAAIVSAIAFGAIHLNGVDNLGQILVPFLTGGIGLVLAFIVLRSRRMGINFVTHIAFNTISTVVLPLFFMSH